MKNFFLKFEQSRTDDAMPLSCKTSMCLHVCGVFVLCVFVCVFCVCVRRARFNRFTKTNEKIGIQILSKCRALAFRDIQRPVVWCLSLDRKANIKNCFLDEIDRCKLCRKNVVHDIAVTHQIDESKIGLVYPSANIWCLDKDVPLWFASVHDPS